MNTFVLEFERTRDPGLNTMEALHWAIKIISKKSELPLVEVEN